jgi:hypothetical protein
MNVDMRRTLQNCVRLSPECHVAEIAGQLHRRFRNVLPDRQPVEASELLAAVAKLVETGKISYSKI